jgi:hypothetical protein
MHKRETIQDDLAALALSALAWAVSDPARAERLLSLTGLSPDDMRMRVTDPALLVAVLAFLEAHEPDLIACADALGTSPAALVDARARLDA